MTREEFLALSPHAQDTFVNEGGVISQDADMNQVMICLDSSEQSLGNEQADKTSSSSLEGATNAQPVSPYHDGFDIKDPLELLMLLDDDVSKGKANGGIDLHEWQIQFLLDFAKGGQTDSDPFQAIVRACNGSGKDKYIIAPCVVWLCMRYRLSRGIVTSSSGQQLDTQTDAYINQLCLSANRKFAGGREEIWKCNYRYYECLPTESPITLFATDEPGKAEGYHPLASGRKMGIFQSEDKSIPDEIDTALDRCTGYTHRCRVSTPGLPMGHFFDIDATARNRDTFTDVTEVKPGEVIQYHIDYKKCSHIKEFYVEQIASKTPGGKNSPVWKSMFLAEFGTTDEMVVIPYTYVWRAFTQPPQPISEPFNKAGLDLSDGGDETVLTVRNGNRHIVTIPFRFDNTEDTVSFLNDRFKEYNLIHPEAYIFADCGGIGKPMLDRMIRQGWTNIRYIDNRHRPYYPKTYLNRGTETYFHLRTLFERREIILLKEDKLIRQLSTRYYKIDANNKHRLLSKPESKSRGYPSPDRADSFVLAFWDYKSTHKEVRPTNDSERPVPQPIYKKPVGSFTVKHFAKGSDSIKQRLGPKRDNSIYRELIDNYNRNLKQAQLESK